MTTLDAALAYASRGLPVFPCRGKLPLTEHGCHDATTDRETIRASWERWPSANVAIATGRRLSILDVAGEPGFASLAELTRWHGPLETASVITGRDGCHLYLATPVGVVIGNSAGRVGAGLDVRGEGGYVIAPPSIHPNGQPYVWGTRRPIAAMPAWLVELARKPAPSTTLAAPRRTALPGEATRYGAAALQFEAARVRLASEGTRNHTLNRAAFALGQLVAGGELAEDLATDELHHAGAHAGLGQHERELTIASGLNAGRNHPRSAPDRTEAECAA